MIFGAGCVQVAEKWGVLKIQLENVLYLYF